jgi:hypothetical protein
MKGIPYAYLPYHNYPGFRQHFAAAKEQKMAL